MKVIQREEMKIKFGQNLILQIIVSGQTSGKPAVTISVRTEDV